MPQTSANVIAGNDAKASDFNKVVADLAEIYSGGPGVPIGAVIDWWSDNTIPTNYKACDGTTLSDAASPLNGLVLPNAINRIARGVAQANLRTTPQSGGSDSHQITVAEMPSHSHGQPAHAHSVNPGIGFGAGGFNPGLGRADGNSPATIWGNGSIGAANPPIFNTGGDSPFSILPAWIGFIKIIRVK